MAWSDKGGGFQDPPVGTHIARCIAIVDLGTQRGEYQGKVNYARKCMIKWELPTELMEDGRPFVVAKFYTQSLGEKANLRHDLVNWRGREFTREELDGFDERNLLDKVCMLSLTKNEAGKVRATGIMQKPKAVDCPARINEIEYLSLEPEFFNIAKYEALGDGLKKMVHASPEWAEVSKGQPAPSAKKNTDDFDDDIPFN